MFTDFIINGQAQGELAHRLMGCQFDPNLMRPYRNEKGQVVVNALVGTETRTDAHGQLVRNASGEAIEFPVYEEQLIADRMYAGMPVPVQNATTLRKDEWIRLDNVVLRAARQRLRAWADLRAANTLGGFDGMSVSILEHEKVNDPGEAMMDMDGMSEGRAFAHQFSLQGVPLPITHADFFLSARHLATSRNRGTPADTLRAEFAGRRVAETIEKTLIGVNTAFAYGPGTTEYADTSKVYGYLTHPDRITKTNMTAPTGSNGSTVLTNWLACRELLYNANFYGPFMVYCSTDYDQYLDNLFSTSEPSAGTLRSRLLQIEGIAGIRRLDYLPSSTNPFTLIFVQMTEDVAQAINGMEITTVQWESMGGMRTNFKVMGIQVPRIRSDYNGNTGLLVATTS